MFTSEELNAKIRELENLDDPPYECFGGKAIPFIGWFWRNVDFDRTPYSFGVIPDNPPLVGFMQNNKWGYGYAHASAKQCLEIRGLIEQALISMEHDDFKAVDDAIQGLLQTALVSSGNGGKE